MTIDELKEACGDGTGMMTIVIPRVSTGERIRFTRKGGPLGEVVCVNSNNETVARFKKSAILKYIESAQG